MDTPTIEHAQGTTSQEQDNLRDAVLRADPANPALQRLLARILRESNPGEVITSYDRMHHRHNRS